MPGKLETGVARVAANLAALQTAEALRSVLERASVPLALLKGAAFLDTLYDDLRERPLKDVDALVPPGQRREAHAALLAAGFRPSAPPPRRRRSWSRRYNRAYLSPSGFELELHTGLAPAGLFRVDDALWDRLVVRRSAGRLVPTLSAEDTLVALAIHEAKQGFAAPAHGREDVARVIERWQPSWSLVVDRARAWGAARALHVTLSGARLIGARVPDDALAALAPGPIGAATLGACVRLPEGRPRLRVDRRLPRAVTAAAAADRWSQRAHFVAHHALLRALDAIPGS